MPGGSPAAWPHVKDIFQSIAAKVADGTPCCDWVGEAGAGHYVKMVHNGIEYGDMQLICEAYNIFKHAGFTTDEMAKIFNEWNDGDLQSYLIQITGKALEQKDPETGKSIVELIVDKAGQKGTGQWTLLNAAENAVVISTINAAVERWYTEKGTWPANNLSDIGADANYFPDGLPVNPMDSSAYTLNATSHRVN